MLNLTSIVRKNIQSLVPYSSARDEFKGTDAIFLDANENPFGSLNRYPDPYQRTLKELIADQQNIDSSSIFIGNGSDEVIDLLFRIFCEPNQDKVLTFGPTYGMYQVSADINAVELIEVPLTEQFDIDATSVLPILSDPSLKMIFICYPNNPTGNCFSETEIIQLLENFNGVVLLDEAYIDFSDKPSWNRQIAKFPNLIVCQTFSKAKGLAAARVGIAFAQQAIIQLLNNVKPPYNVSQLNQEAAIQCLENIDKVNQEIALIKDNRSFLQNQLEKLSIIKRIYPSQANFILAEVTDADSVYNQLTRQGIIPRNRSKIIPNCIRFTIGTTDEVTALINALKQLS